MSNVPVRTDEQRMDALAKAAEVRAKRAGIIDYLNEEFAGEH